MKYTPKELKGNPNISSLPPLRDFFDALLKTIGAIAVLYIILGLIVDIIAPRVSLRTEIAIGRSFECALGMKEDVQQDPRVQRVLDNLVLHAVALPPFNYRVYVKSSSTPNALALPGGTILIFDSLLKEISSENELAMVLGHELAHFSRRDHLKGLGRQMVFLLLSTLLFGSDNPTSRFFSNSLTNVEMRFSQAQEMAADLYALELVGRIYGHASGTLDFYEKMAAKDKKPGIFYLFASHPYPKKRVLNLKSEIVRRKISLGEEIVSFTYPVTNGQAPE